MRAQEFQSVPAEKILAYVKSTQGDGNFYMDNLITDSPTWRLVSFPISNLRIDDDQDPHGRVLDIDYDYADELHPEDIKRRPIVAQADGVIIDGNHRAYRAQQLGWKEIPAYVPA
jgi:hypothetical protein